MRALRTIPSVSERKLGAGGRRLTESDTEGRLNELDGA